MTSACGGSAPAAVAPTATGASPTSFGHVLRFPPPEATASPGSVQVLQGPRSRESVRAVVRRFFEAVTSESHLDLAELLTENAIVQYPNSNTSSALVSWVRRFATLDYQGLQGDLIVAERHLEIFERTDFERLRAERDFKVTPETGEIVVVTPVLVSNQDKHRLFGSQIQFLLSPAGEAWRIRSMYEDYTAH